MKSVLALSALIAIATATSDAITIRSTTISSDCPSSSELPVLPSSALAGAYYGNSSIPQSNAPAPTSKSKKISYAYETAYATDAVDITRTVCDANGQCHVTTEVGRLTTYTTTINGILTVITTGVPSEPTEVTSTEQVSATSTFYQSNAGQAAAAAETNSTVTSIATTESAVQSSTKKLAAPEESSIDVTSSIESNPASSAASATTPASSVTAITTAAAAPVEPHTEYLTTVVTITSCSDNKCSEVPQTTGVKIISSVDTVHTTYCPLTEASQSPIATSAPESAPAVAQASSETVKPDSSSASTKSKTPATVNVITDNIVTETPSVEQQQATSQETVAAQSASTSASESPSINTYEGAAISMKATGFVTVAISVLMMLI
ncbi:hypothetical protein KGF57_000202 [Candida theae]|uniref:Uncharacterized protein n=1 Tax=Candida theae TaxID=1198502 RepID=A0AAD5G127_9ASCO|nr:uncharacterized protein KGF57_000202 [Candida theae]KAI5968343.1 hypothetical protein KGF57_000202 [Candida theae]